MTAVIQKVISATVFGAAPCYQNLEAFARNHMEANLTAIDHLGALPSKVTASSSSSPRLHFITRLAIVVLCLLSIGIGARQALWCFSHGPVVSDFRIFMTGVELVQSGDGRDLYSFDAQRRTQALLYPETQIAGLLPFNHLAFELLFYWPFSAFPYHTAIIAWAIANLGVVALIGWLLTPYTRAIRQRTGIPIVVYLLAFSPVMYTLGEGQDSLLFLLLVVLSLRAMDARLSFLGGFILALACFKFHLALLIAFFVFACGRKWRALPGFAVGGIVAGGISAAMVGPGIVAGYLGMLRNQSAITPWGFIPWFMPNLRGFLQWALIRWLDLGSIQPLILLASAVVGGATAWIVWRNSDQHSLGLTYSAAILATVLISYHLHMQDLAIVALPILVLVDEALRGRMRQRTTMAREAVSDDSLAEAPGRLNRTSVALIVAVASLYLFRIAGEPFPFLNLRGCLLALPLLLLWMVSLEVSRAD